MSIICPDCKGTGKKRIGLFSKKVCSTCHGKCYIKTPSPTQVVDTQHSSMGSSTADNLFLDTNNPVHMNIQPTQEVFEGHGGRSGGAGASQHYDVYSSPGCDTQAPPSFESPASNECSSGSGSD